MKKKGLIISTIVMVVVLVASLTTATYAWFNASASVKVNDITLAITSNANVNVGVRTSDPTSGSTSYDNYHTESMTSTATNNTIAWDLTSATPGLGPVLNFTNLNLTVNKALGTGTGTTSSDFVIDNAMFDYANAKPLDSSKTKNFIMAEAGASEATAKVDTALLAVANQNYLHAVIGVEANQSNIAGMYVKVTVATTDNKTTLGMNAALHFLIKTKGNVIKDFEPFGVRTTEGGIRYSTTKASFASNSNTETTIEYDSTSHQVTSTFYFWVDKKTSGTFEQNGGEIVDFEILAFIEGADADCNNNALGTSCTISIEFDGTSDISKLAGTSGAAITTVKWLSFVAES